MIIDVHTCSFSHPEHGCGLGDCIQMLPVVAGIAEANPDATVRMVTRDRCQQWCELGWPHWREWCKLDGQLRISGSEKILWPNKYSFVETDLVCAQEGSNRMSHWAANVGVTPRFLPPRISDEDKAWAERLVAEFRKPGQKLVWIAPYASEDRRTWSKRKWTELLVGLGKCGVAIGGFQSRYDSTNAFWFIGGHMLQDTPAGRSAALLLQSNLFIGNDSGMTHLAGWLGVPSIALCAMTRGDIVFGCYPKTRTIDSNKPCAFCMGLPDRCFKPWCWHGCDALNGIEADKVLVVAREMLG